MPNVTLIRANAFENCTNLRNVIFTKLTYLGRQVFKNCTNLAIITLGEKAPAIGKQIFIDIIVPQTITIQIPKNAEGYGEAGTYNEKSSSVSSYSDNWANYLRGAGPATRFGSEIYDIEKLADWRNGTFHDADINDNITLIIEEIES
jgi:hypothetical protein